MVWRLAANFPAMAETLIPTARSSPTSFFSFSLSVEGLGFHPQNTRITLDFGSVTDWTAVPLWTKFKREGVSVATRSSLP